MTKPSGKARAKKIIGILAGAISALVLILAVVLSISAVVAKQKNQAVSIFGYSFSIVVTGSMQPEIKIGDLIVSKKVNISEIAKDDDIIFLSDDPNFKDLRIVHRVQTVNSDQSFITYHINETVNGQDTQGHYEDSTPAKRIEGKVVAVSSGFGKIFSFFTSSYNLVFAVMLIVLGIVMTTQIINIVKTVKKKETEPQAQQDSKQMYSEVLSEIEKEYGKEAIEILKNTQRTKPDLDDSDGKNQNQE